MPEVVFVSDDGMASSSPLAGPSSILFTGDAVDRGPTDHGSVLDLRFEPVAAHASRSFHLFYGAAPDEPEALKALTAMGAKAWSLGHPTTDAEGMPTSAAVARPDIGKPATFLFGFTPNDPTIGSYVLGVGPDDSVALVGEQICLQVSLNTYNLNANNIRYTVTGANPRSGIPQQMPSYGPIVICYQGVNPGVDTVTATYAGVSDTATVTWHGPAASPLVAGPVFRLNRSGDRKGVIVATPSAVLTDAVTGAALPGRDVIFKASGVQFCSAQTNDAGRASCPSLLQRGSALPTVLGQRGYDADFPGDGLYVGSSDTGSLTARARPAPKAIAGRQLPHH